MKFSTPVTFIYVCPAQDGIYSTAAMAARTAVVLPIFIFGDAKRETLKVCKAKSLFRNVEGFGPVVAVVQSLPDVRCSLADVVKSIRIEFHDRIYGA